LKESKPAEERYRLRVAGPAPRALTHSLPEKIAHAAYEFINGPLLDNPRRVGKPLKPPLAPAYSARRGDYHVLYLIDDAARTVEITAISHRADVYRS
jgi:mRNA-degrading endonuclease RelE of RelBE toxin-antitoxin system